MTVKELIIKGNKELDEKLAKAKEEGNLVVKDATEDEAVIRETFKKEKESSACSQRLYLEDLIKPDVD